jgi:hypothetical protein
MLVLRILFLALMISALVVGCSSDDDAATDASTSTIDGSSADDAGSGVDSGVAAMIPPNTTDCTLNAAGCLESAAASVTPCFIELDAAITTASVNVRVDGTLAAGRRASIMATAFAEKLFAPDSSFSWQGYSARFSRSGFIPNMDETATISLHDGAALSLESDFWTIVEGDYAVSIQGSFDTTAMSGTATFEANGAPATPLSTTAMLAPTSDKMVITVTGAEVCNIVVTSP